MKTKPYTFVTVTLTAVAGILCIWVLHKYVESPVSTPIPEVDVRTDYYNFGTNGEKICGPYIHRENIRGPYILTMEFGGQQGAGMHALIAQQCFVSNLGIPAYIVEPFIINSVLRHTYPNTHDRNMIKFSDMFSIDVFNAESNKSGFGALVRWEHFLNSGPNRTVLVEIQSGGQKKGTDVVWDGYSTQDSPCYRDKKYPEHRNVINTTLCLVRIVRICCVNSRSLNEVSIPETVMTAKQLRRGIFGNWKSEKVTILFKYWNALWHVPPAAVCRYGFRGKIFPSEQVLKFANQYRDTYLKSNKVVAFVLRFEHLIYRNYNVNVCLKKLRHAHNYLKLLTNASNASVFVAADLGRYQSGSWEDTFSISGIDHKRGEKMKSTFMNALSDFIQFGSQWKFDEWDNSFNHVTGGIEDAGYIATLQKSIASKADCLVFLSKGESAFQDLVKQEFIKNHPTVSEQCIHYLCTKDCPNCTHFYSKPIYL